MYFSFKTVKKRKKGQKSERKDHSVVHLAKGKLKYKLPRDVREKVQFTMPFSTQGILYCTYIGTAQVHIALLKFYMKTAYCINKSRYKCFRLKHKFLFVKYNYDDDIVTIKNQNGNCLKCVVKIDKFNQM